MSVETLKVLSKINRLEDVRERIDKEIKNLSNKIGSLDMFAYDPYHEYSDQCLQLSAHSRDLLFTQKEIMVTYLNILIKRKYVLGEEIYDLENPVY